MNVGSVGVELTEAAEVWMAALEQQAPEWSPWAEGQQQERAQMKKRRRKTTQQHRALWLQMMPQRRRLRASSEARGRTRVGGQTFSTVVGQTEASGLAIAVESLAERQDLNGGLVRSLKRRSMAKPEL